MLFLVLYCMPLYAASNSPSESTDKLAPVGVKGVELKELESGKSEKPKRLIIPPYISEKTSKTTFKTVLPLFYYKERKGEGATKDIGVLPFYWAHNSKNMHARVYFPFYWRFRTPKLKTDIVLLSHYSRSNTAFNFGISPIFYFGKNSKKGTSYQVILPPLFWNFKKPDGGFTLALLYYDYRDKLDYQRGFVPFFFSSHKNDKTVTSVIPPLFWYVNDAINYKTTIVLPPLFLTLREKGWSAGLLPILYFARDKNWSRNMVMPLYYGSRVGKLKSHYFPVLLSYFKNSPNLKQGGIAVFYHWYKHEGKYFNMYSPLVWRWGNNRTLTSNWLVPPLFYRGKSPVLSNTMVGMIYWNFHDFHLKKTLAIMPLFSHQKNFKDKSTRTWVFPTFDFGKQQEGFHARLHPVIYIGKNSEKSHLVVAPVLWHFNNKKSKNSVIFPLWWQFKNKKIHRTSRVVFPLWWQFDDYKRDKYNRIIFPLYWDFHNKSAHSRTVMTFPPLYWRVRDKNSSRTGVLNISMHKGEKKGHSFWTFNIFPLLLFGKPPSQYGARWEILHGLVGWRRQGSTRQFKFLWIPFTFSK